MAITDLINTKWELNNTVARLGQVEYDIQGSAVFEDATYNCEFNSLICRDQGNIMEDGDCEVLVILSTINDDYEDGFPSTFFNPSGRVIYNAYSGEAYVTPKTLPKSSMGLSKITTIFITSGTDTTNTDLIAWLQTNATQIIVHTVQIINPQMYILPPTKVVGNDLVVSAEEVVVNEAEEEVKVNTFEIWNTISNDLDDTYQYEDGMTWDKFINSEYNTDSFALYGSNNNIVGKSGTYLYNSSGSASSTDYVYKTDIINKSKYWIISSSFEGGGSN